MTEARMRRVAITGGAGRLGSWVVRGLLPTGATVRVVDREPPVADWSDRLEFAPAEVQSRHDLLRAFRDCDVVLHLAGLHGAHLAANVSRRSLWQNNVDGTCRALEAAVACGVRQFMLASSTSVYGPGSPEGDARVLTETTDPEPDDVYDLSKLAAERALTQACADTGIDGVALRFGRFFFGSFGDYQLRKLSTGLDVRDAVQAIKVALDRPQSGMRVYCIASDLPLTADERRALGHDVASAIEPYAPTLEAELSHCGLQLPDRVGKSVSTEALQRELGYQPTRDLAWWARQLETRRTQTHTPARSRHVSAADWGLPLSGW